jgi:spermidine synthase
MAIEIMLIFVFQNTYGYMYQKIGIIIALFMLGLALGAYWMRRQLKGGLGSAPKILLLIEFMLCAYSVSLPFVIQELIGGTQSGANALVVTEYSFMALVFIVAVLVGIEFPLVSHILIDAGNQGGYVAGWVDAIDHFGACMGALLTGTIFVPLLGIHRTCFVMGFLNFTSFVFLLITFVLRKR